MNRLHTALISLVTAAALAASPLAHDAQANPYGTTAKGHVGWDTFRNLDDLPLITQGVDSLQFSSFDRTGGNWKDGFDGTFSCLRQAEEGCVIAERAGAGEITSIWFTRDWGNVTATGNIIITLDGTTVLDAPLQDVVDGKLGAPFAEPFVSNADNSSGGVYIKVPMPYRESMRVSTTNNPLFYHVNYRVFADAEGVTTFDPDYVPEDVFAAAETWGHEDPKPQQRRVTTSTTELSIPAGSAQTIGTASKAGTVTELKLQLPEIVGPELREEITDDGRAFTGSSQFQATIDPANEGVQLTRRLDSGIGGQVGRIYVGDVHVADWPAVTPTAGQWLDLTVDLPAEHTAGKSSIEIRTEYASGSLDFNEFRYVVDSIVDGEPVRTDELDVGTSTEARASETAHDYVITGQVWQGERTYTYPADDSNQDEVLASNELLRNLRVRITADGEQMVDAPLGEFFGAGLSRAEVRAMYFAMDADPEGYFTSWWPMPYRQTLTVELVNESSVDVTTGTAWLSTSREGSIGGQLAGASPSIGYFQAESIRDHTTRGTDWIMLDQSGTGKVVGVNHTVRGTMEFGNTREYLEGDERIYVDGSLSPAWHGTGSEDFYEGGWYYREVEEFTTPWVGATMIQFGTDGCTYKCDSMYRTLIADAIPFSSHMTFGMEHGGQNTADAEYGTTTFWYGHADRPSLRLTDVLDVGVLADEAAHSYSGDGDVRELTATFEGNHDHIPVTDEYRAHADELSFTMKIARDNRGVELRRMSDQENGYQAADVYVDGTLAGRWLQPLANEYHRWLEDDFMIPSSLTRNKSSITVRLVPVEGHPEWTDARYEARSVGPLKVDNTSPSGVGAITASDGRSAQIALSWKRAVDDVVVSHYEVYGSRDPGFTADEGTLLGTTVLPGFLHGKLGLNEDWHYRIRAVDTAGNVGPLSEEVRGVTGSTVRVEAEGLLPPVSATMPVEQQGNCCGVTWSNGAQLWLRAAGEGDTATFTLDVPVDGVYSITVGLTQAPDYGLAQFSIDGENVGEPLDGWRADGVGTATGSLGSVSLTVGNHELTITSAGKNEASRGYFMGVDYLEMTLQNG